MTVYRDTRYPALRLVTCGGPFDAATGQYLDNIIVYAHLVSAQRGWPGRYRRATPAIPARPGRPGIISGDSVANRMKCPFRVPYVSAGHHPVSRSAPRNRPASANRPGGLFTL